jgi:hypothetical protein
MMLQVRTFILLIIYLTLGNQIHSQSQVFIEHSKLPRAQREAILVLPGFGSKVFGTKKIAKFFKNKGFDIFIPRYISRKTVRKSIENLDKFIVKHELKEYKKLHVFSYIFGSWTINSWIKKYGSNNIATLIFDRSPLQERAPATLMKDMPFISKLIFGNVMRDFNNTPYLPANDSSIVKGIFIETFATKLIYKHKSTAFEKGPVTFDVKALNQSFDDFCYLPLNHDEMYNQLDVFGNEVLHFIKNGQFSEQAKQFSFVENPFVKFEKK